VTRADWQRAWRHGLFEARRIVGNGEQLILNLILPLLLALFGARALRSLDVAVGWDPEHIAATGAITLAAASAAFTSQAIHTAFERKYGSMRLLGTTPLGGRALVAGKAIAVALIVTVQAVVIASASVIFRGWRPDLGGLPWAALAAVLALVCFVSLALIVASLVKVEWVLAVANLAWLAMLSVGALVLPAGDGASAAVAWLPPGAFGAALRDTLADGSLPGPALAVLAAWALVLSLLAARYFRWSAR